MFFKCKTEQECKLLFRKLALKLHPDHGGSQELMVLLQESHDAAKARLLGSVKDYVGKLAEGYKKQAQQASVKSTPEKLKAVQKDVIKDGDPRIKILEAISRYQKKHPLFKCHFFDSVCKFYEDYEIITVKQYNILVSIYSSFIMGAIKWPE